MICFLMLNLGNPSFSTSPVSGSVSGPRLRNHETALSLEDAATMSGRPSPSKSADTAQRAPMAWLVTMVRRVSVRRSERYSLVGVGGRGVTVELAIVGIIAVVLIVDSIVIVNLLSRLMPPMDGARGLRRPIIYIF